MILKITDYEERGKLRGGEKRVKRHGHLEKQNTKLKEYFLCPLFYFYAYVIPNKQLNQARGIWHFIGGWYKYNGSEKKYFQWEQEKESMSFQV